MEGLPELLLTDWGGAAREKIVGWYHTGPRLREADLDIHELMTNYVNNPVLVVSEVEVSRSAVLGDIVSITIR
jgi:proteasome lid subunit RPN8/RPN11